MFLKIGLTPENRKFHWFLWKPHASESNGLVFGVNVLVSEAECLPQQHAFELKKAHSILLTF